MQGFVLLLISTRVKVNLQGTAKAFDNVCFVKLMNTYDVNTVVEKEQKLYGSFDVKLIAAWAGYDRFNTIEKTLSDRYGVVVKTRYNGSIITENALICDFGVVNDFRNLCNKLNSISSYYEASTAEINNFVIGRNVVDSKEYSINKVCNSNFMMFNF